MASFSYRTSYAKSIAQIDAMCAQVSSIMALEDVDATEGTVIFIGRFKLPADQTLPEAIDRLRPFGRTPRLRRREGRDYVYASDGIYEPSPSPLKVRVAWASCLLACIVTTIAAGSYMVNQTAGFWELLNSAAQLDWPNLVAIVGNGLAFSITLLLILAFHELGHYLAARVHGVEASPPFFIPVPFGLGTVGAFIRLRSPVPNRRALFDISLAGPVAGFLTALAFFLIGLWLSRYTSVNAHYLFGNSLVGDWAIDWVWPSFLDIYSVPIHPVTISAWIGLSLTAINLIPIGQLDGGHIAYAVLGKHSKWLSTAAILLMVLAGFYWAGWFIWAIFVLFLIRRHDSLLNDITPLDRPRRWIGLAVVVWFLFIISLEPF